MGKVYVVILDMLYEIENYHDDFSSDFDSVKTVAGVFTNFEKAKEIKDFCLEKIRNEYSDKSFLWERENLVRNRGDLVDWSTMEFEVLIEEKILDEPDMAVINHTI